MLIQCKYCGSTIDDDEPICPHCGAVNDKVTRTADGVPKTIEELKAYITEHNIPADKFRFFIGENYEGAKAFGIYHDPQSDKFIVYKNKADGTRAVRYEGTDEETAVNEIYQKLQSEMASFDRFKAEKAQREGNARPANDYNQHLRDQQIASKADRIARQSSRTPRRSNDLLKTLVTIVIVVVIFNMLANAISRFAAWNVLSGLTGGSGDSGSNGYYSSYDYDDDDDGGWWSSSSDSSSWWDDDDDDSWWDDDDDDSWSSDWDSDWDDDWDSGWDSDYSSDWDSDW